MPFLTQRESVSSVLTCPGLPWISGKVFDRSRRSRAITCDHGDSFRSPFIANQVLTPSRYRFPKEEIPVKYLFAVILLAALSPLSFAQETSEIATPPNGDNQKAEVSQWIGPVKI